MTHPWSLLVKEFPHFDIHAGGMVVHDEEERDGASTGKVLQAGMDTGFKAIEEESVELDDILMEGQLAEDLILTSKLIADLHRKTYTSQVSVVAHYACMHVGRQLISMLLTDASLNPLF